MNRNRVWSYSLATAIGVLGLGSHSQAQSAPQAATKIGMVVSRGTFTVGGVTSTGTATIFSGDSLSTDSASSQVHLVNGVNLTLAPHSSGAIYADHVALGKGTIFGQVGSQYRVETRGVTLQPVSPGTEAEVQVAENRVTVAIPKGHADIDGAHGAILSHMVPGQVLSYQNVNSGMDEETRVQVLGVLTRQDGHYLIRDRVTNVAYELSGNIPGSDLDKLVMVTGELGAGKSTVPQVDRLVNVTEIKQSDATTGYPCEHDPARSVAREMIVNGVLNREEGHYLVHTTDHGVVEVIGDVDSSEIGKQVHMKGAILTGQTAFAPAEQLVYTEKRKFVYSASPCAGLITGGVMITTGMLLYADGGKPDSVIPISY
jgi:hypothetical protein